MNLQETLSDIEHFGQKFNASAADDESSDEYELDAYCSIVDYMIANNYQPNDHEWERLFAEYEEDGLFAIQEEIHEIHRTLTEGKFQDLKQIPLDLILLFKTFDVAFHYEYMEGLRKRIYVDMDNVLVDFPSAFECYDAETLKSFENNRDDIDGIFSKMKPMKDAISSMETLFRYYDVYILSTAPWNNPSAWTDKLNWVKRYLPIVGYKRLILSHHKNLNHGDFLIDDRIKNGVLGFQGKHVHFGADEFPDWETVTAYLIEDLSNSSKE